MRRRDLLCSTAALASSVALKPASGLAHCVVDDARNVPVIAREEFRAFFGSTEHPSYNDIIAHFKGDFVCTQENIQKLSELNRWHIVSFIQFYNLTCNIIKTTDEEVSLYEPYINGRMDSTNGIPELILGKGIISKHCGQIKYKNGLRHTDNEEPARIIIARGNKVILDWYQYNNCIKSKKLNDDETINYLRANPHILNEMRDNFQKVFNHTLQLPLWAQPGIPTKPLDWRTE